MISSPYQWMCMITVMCSRLWACAVSKNKNKYFLFISLCFLLTIFSVTWHTCRFHCQWQSRFQRCWRCCAKCPHCLHYNRWWAFRFDGDRHSAGAWHDESYGIMSLRHQNRRDQYELRWTCALVQCRVSCTACRFWL